MRKLQYTEIKKINYEIDIEGLVRDVLIDEMSIRNALICQIDNVDDAEELLYSNKEFRQLLYLALAEEIKENIHNY